MSFDAVRARFVGPNWRVDEFRGEGTMFTGACANIVFTFVGTLPKRSGASLARLDSNQD